jgi:hypothetical protein
MEMLNWMKRVSLDTDKKELLMLIDSMHGIINAMLEKNKENERLIKALTQGQKN